MNYLLYLLPALLLFSACGSDAPAEAVLPAAAAPNPDPDRVVTGPLPSRRIGNDVRCTGRIEIPPTDLVSVHTRIGGQVSGLRHLPGDYVARGTQLMRISNPELIRLQRQLLEGRASLTTAEKELERQRILSEGQATTAAALDDSRGRVELLHASVRGLESELEAYGIDLAALLRDSSLQSSVGVYAGRAGFVHAVNTNYGSMVSPADELMQLAGTEHLHLELMIPSREVAHIRKGQRVRYRLPYVDREGTATIEKVNPMVDAESATLQVHCHLTDRPEQGLVPGLFVNAVVETGDRTVHGLPAEAVLREGQDYYAYRVAGEGYSRTLLRNAAEVGDFVTFSNPPDGEWVIGGAYYVE